MAIIDSPVINRLAELRVKQKLGKLSDEQLKEMELCLDWIVNYCYRQALLLNYSLMASMTNDVDWQHEICLDLDKE